MNCLLFDMDGVLYEGDNALPGAVESIIWCRNKGIPHLFLTNTTSRPRHDLVVKLASMGIEVSLEEIFTPPVAAAEWLVSHTGGPVALFVPEATRGEFTDISVADVQTKKVSAVVLGDLGEHWTFSSYNRAFRLLMDNPDAVLIALGMTRYWQVAEGLRLDVGPFVKGLEYATGRKAVVMGKPATAFFRSALAQVSADASETVMIGDDIRGDIDGSQQVGIKGVLVRTGKFRPDDLAQGIQPYDVLDAIAALPAWWCYQGW